MLFICPNPIHSLLESLGAGISLLSKNVLPIFLFIMAFFLG